MNSKNKDQFKQNIYAIQQKIEETISSQENEVVVTINGHMEITTVKISEDVTIPNLERILKEVINKGIKIVSLKLNGEILRLQQRL